MIPVSRRKMIVVSPLVLRGLESAVVMSVTIATQYRSGSLEWKTRKMVAKNKHGKELPNWKDPAKGQSNGAQSDFVQYELSKDQQAACKAWPFTSEDAWEAMDKLSQAAYKMTFRFDEKNNAPACWIIAEKENQMNPNMILPGRGSTPMKAFKQACYKHFVLFEGAWGDYIRKRDTEEIDD